MSKSVYLLITLFVVASAGAGQAGSTGGSDHGQERTVATGIDVVAPGSRLDPTPGVEPAPSRMNRLVDAVRRVPLRPRRIWGPVRHRLDPEPAAAVVIKLRF